MPPLHPDAALAAGVTVVTPNNRLARALIAQHDAAMLRARKRTWTAARALPWSVWAASLWREALESGAAPPEIRLLSEAEARYLWTRIVQEDTAVAAGLVDVQGAADSAFEAWSLMNAWGAGGESWRAWRSEPDESDVGAFARWAERYRRELERLRAYDIATLPDAIRAWAPRVPAWHGREVALAGFLELSPQQDRLHESLAAAGMKLAPATPRQANSDVRRATGATPRDELRAALEWARALAEESPDRFIGIAVADLAAQRDEVRALADDVLCPALQLPGNARSPRPYSLSLGAPLAEHPMVAAALGLITLAHSAVPRGNAAALARSPFFAGAWFGRAMCERAWIDEGRTLISWSDFAVAMPSAVAAQLRGAVESLSLRAQAPAGWVAQWRTLLDRCGWPGAAPLEGARYETRQAWERLLDAFAGIGHVEPRMTGAQAPAILRGMAGRTVFQPESPRAAIGIMGTLEAAALDFDALWVVGLSAQRWPPPPQPNPMLPLAWQRERGVPRSSADRELAFARLVTARLASNALHVVMSAPAAIEDYPMAPSALIEASWPSFTPPSMRPATATQLAAARDIEAIVDDRAPVFAIPLAPGGAGTIAAQSTCPFKAMAERRLRVAPWPGGFEALSYQERGQIVHAMMAAFWLDVRSHAALVALDDAALVSRIDKAAETARDSLRAERWRLMPAVVAEAEVARIAQIARDWIDKFERPRPPFTVARVEEKAEATLAGLTFRLKLDRVDTLADGRAAIIDYKTGAVDNPRSWFAMRPRSPQLGVYALALRSQVPPLELAAVAYARLKAGDIAVLGVTSERELWQSLIDAGTLRDPSGWDEIQSWWERRLPELAAEFRDGVASVTPRDAPGCCRACNLQPLCRISEANIAREPES